MKSRTRSTVAFQQALALAAVVLAVQGCGLLGQGSPTPNRPVEVVGVVASESIGGQGTVTEVYVTFDDGRNFTYDTDYQVLAGIRPHVGNLLLAGTLPRPWTIGASLEDPASGWPVGCYGLNENGTENETTVDLEVGVTLPKAPNFDPTGRPKGSGRIWGGTICLDRQGRVIKIMA
jgi:hypothetical protein